ncbi:MAG: hypothetical protein D6725_13155 [Planctomycetota bacterium]|nr:MAG: hypothetical protein D6725_13155 [Planctomycetota bacterium]
MNAETTSQRQQASETPTSSDVAVLDPAEEITVPPPPEEVFDHDDLEHFEEDDIDAGRTIGKMLSFLFVYTVIVMTVVAVWTWTVAGH